MLKRFSYWLAAVFAESLEARCQVENEDVVGAAPTGDAPTTSELSTILLPTKVRLILEILRYYLMRYSTWSLLAGLQTIVVLKPDHSMENRPFLWLPMSSLAIMVLTMYHKRVLGFHGERFQLPVTSQCRTIIENTTNAYWKWSAPKW